jgi:zinc-ribbon family
MIFYGSRAKSIKTGKIRAVLCPNCEKETDMVYDVYGRYAHVYWIPFFPISKTNVVECNSCKATYDLKNLDEKVKQKFQRETEVNPTKNPIWFFSGLFGIIAIIGLVVFFNYIDKNNTNDFGKNPKAGDIFYETTPKGAYSTSKILQVTKDSISVLQNNMETDQKTSVDEIAAKPENYEYPVTISKKYYLEMIKNGDSIYKIERK